MAENCFMDLKRPVDTHHPQKKPKPHFSTRQNGT